MKKAKRRSNKRLTDELLRSETGDRNSLVLIQKKQTYEKINFSPTIIHFDIIIMRASKKVLSVSKKPKKKRLFTFT